MGAPLPFEAWARPGRQAFEFWISFFPTAPLFGVEWRFGAMLKPEANPFMPTAASPFLVPFPGTRAAAAASKPGELDTPALADEESAKPVARAAEATADAARDATRIATKTQRAVGRSIGKAVEATVDPDGPTVDAAPEAASAAGRTAEAAGEAPTEAVETAAPVATKTVAKTGDMFESAEASAPMMPSAMTAVETTVHADGADAPDSASVEQAIAAGPRPEVLLDEKPDEPDDLKQIKGIGQGLERQLNALGVWRLDQIAGMTDADLAWIDANLTVFKGRCFRDDWIGQAKERLAR